MLAHTKTRRIKRSDKIRNATRKSKSKPKEKLIPCRESLKEHSDIDILVDFDSKRGLFGFMSLKNYLEELLHCDVDL